MLSKENLALELLYSIVTSSSLPAKIDFIKFKGFLGIINSAVCEAEISSREYFTNLCASVATNVKPSVENWKKTPLITGRKSSLPAANIVFEIAVARTSPNKVVELGSWSSIEWGNSSPLAYAKAYLPWLELTSIVLLSSTVNVKGCSGNVFKVSNNKRAGTQIVPFSLLSTSNFDEMVVSKSDAETVNKFWSSWNKKLSNIGRVLLLLIIPPKTWSCFNKYELDTINFILMFLWLC